MRAATYSAGQNIIDIHMYIYIHTYIHTVDPQLYSVRIH